MSVQVVFVKLIIGNLMNFPTERTQEVEEKCIDLAGE